MHDVVKSAWDFKSLFQKPVFWSLLTLSRDHEKLRLYLLYLLY